MFKKTITLLACIVLTEAAGIIGSLFTTPAISGWYATLTKPTLAPPNWVFGPVWTILFALMGIALYLVLSKRTTTQKTLWCTGIIFFGIQLILNVLWSALFFGTQNPFLAFIELIVLWIVILATTIFFYKISKPSAWLLVPYLLWVAFAGYLNISIWHLNSSADSGQVACTQEVKLCPNGSYVGRTGPNCEFAACPSNDLWKTIASNGITFQYPETLLTQYIHEVDWPPQIQVLNEPFTCTEAGEETTRAGKTEKRLVDDREYCRTSIVEGAASSIYTQYAYAFPLYSTGSTQADRKTAIFTFTTRATQCGNYDETERNVCENERETLDLDSVVDRMARSVKF
jgi:tryptophan-rich sensory protein